jgi:heme oxygenase
MLALKKLVLLGPRTCLEIATLGKAVLFNEAVQLGINGTAPARTFEE